ncbi:MAG: prolyl oligopeptidase family serine peptidase [Cytophagales bacterium]
MRSAAFILFVLFSLYLQAQKSELKLSEIMKGEDFVGTLPDEVIWSEQSDAFYFKWNESVPGVKPHYVYDLEVNAITEVDPLEAFMEIPSSGDYNSSRTLKVYAKAGDIFLNTISENKIERLTQTNVSESNPRFVMDDAYIVYESENNLFLRALSGGNIKQITNFQSGKKKEKKDTEQEKWLKKDQVQLFDIMKKREEERKNKEERSRILKDLKPKTIYYGEMNISSVTLSEDGKYVYYQLHSKVKNENTNNLDYVSDNGYAKILEDRPKVGQELETEELWVYQIENDTTLQFDTKSIPGIFEKPAFFSIYDKEKASKPWEEPRKILIHGPDIAKNGNAVVEIKAQDNKDRWFMYLNPEDASWKMIERQHDDKWVGGPGITGWNMVPGNKGWMPDNEHYWFHSEESGYSHLYSVNTKSGKKKAMSKGEFEVHEAFLSKDKTHFYLVSNEKDPGERHLYKMDLEGKERTQLSSGEGHHELFLSPDEKYIVSRYSSYNKPWELYLMENKAGAEMKQITESTKPEFNAYSWKVPELIYFKASDGEKVRARLYKPENSIKNNAAVIFVHGAGYLQNAHKWWSSYYREYMFHNLLVDMGYTVLDIDYRASEGYGSNWRTAIYRHMGGKDLSDQVDGAKYLVDELGIDKNKIGIYGGSYGGFITLMALFTAPETFACGAAIRSVSDWAHYNHPYTSYLLNTPVEDSMAYMKSSPIYFADGLDDPLLMLHGVVDTNVQYQDIIRLTQKLIELGKKDWELASYPIEPHGFKEASSWTDEYGRILKLFEENLR